MVVPGRGVCETGSGTARRRTGPGRGSRGSAVCPVVMLQGAAARGALAAGTQGVRACRLQLVHTHYSNVLVSFLSKP